LYEHCLTIFLRIFPHVCSKFSQKFQFFDVQVYTNSYHVFVAKNFDRKFRKKNYENSYRFAVKPLLCQFYKIISGIRILELQICIFRNFYKIISNLEFYQKKYYHLEYFWSMHILNNIVSKMDNLVKFFAKILVVSRNFEKKRQKIVENNFRIFLDNF